MYFLLLELQEDLVVQESHLGVKALLHAAVKSLRGVRVDDVANHSGTWTHAC
jgi:hypothetical protein